MQGSLLELDFLIRSCEDNTMNSLELVHTLSLEHPELIDCSLQDQPMNVPTFSND